MGNKAASERGRANLRVELFTASRCYAEAEIHG
jgi:hypothetical protein